jgi:hypothetical protein
MKNSISMSLQTIRVSHYVFWFRECICNISDSHKLRVEKIFKWFLCLLSRRHFDIFSKKRKSHESCLTYSETIKKTQNVCEIQQMCLRFKRNRLFKIYCRDTWYSNEFRENRYDKEVNRINDASSCSNFYKIREILQKIHKNI